MSSRENGVFNCAKCVEHLTIRNCPNFSIAALRRFVESRLKLLANTDDPWIPVTPRIQSIQVFGNVALISQADSAWFGANLKTIWKWPDECYVFQHIMPECVI
jgi:hypothetical protein